jgi:chitinase
MKLAKIFLAMLLTFQIFGCDYADSNNSNSLNNETTYSNSIATKAVAYPSWDAGTVYNGGETVYWNNHNWSAKWWTQGQEPGTTGEWGVWKDLGPVNDDTIAPSVPNSITALNITYNTVDLTWTASTDNVGVAGYNVYHNNIIVATSATNSVTVTNLSELTNYGFSVSAFDAAGNESALSTPISIKTGPKPVDNLAPTIPTNLTTGNITENSITLNWPASTDNIGVAGYKIFKDGVYEKTVSSPSAVIDKLTENTTYTFTISAFDAANNESAQSAALTAKTIYLVGVSEWTPGKDYKIGDKAVYIKKIYRCQYAHKSMLGWEPPNVPTLWVYESDQTGPPATPAGLKATAASTSQINVEWSEAAFAESYDLEVDGIIVAGVTNPYNHAGLLKNTAHSYRVRAVNIDGASAWSTAVSATTLAQDPLPTTPANLTASPFSSSQINIKWDTVTGANSYDLKIDGIVVNVTTNSYEHKNLAENSTHTYSVAAKNTTGSSAFSIQVSAKTYPAGNTGLPARIINGYWHNFNNGSGFIQLRDISRDFDVVNISFAEPTGTDGTMGFLPDPGYVTIAQFKEDVKFIQARGQKVIISIGGANGQVQLLSTSHAANFINSMTTIIREYGFDGMDIDFEGHSLSLNLGDDDFANPTTPIIVHTITAIKGVCSNFAADFILTMAPETFFVQLGYSFYGGISAGADRRAGAYLPVIHALRDKLTFLQVQNYNSGPITGLDDQYHNMGTADFHVAMIDMLLTGFPINRDATKFFPPLRQDQILVGLPANVNAGGGFTSVAEVHKALDALIKNIPIGSYQLRTPGGYPNLRGVMTWSINWDQFNNFEFSREHRKYLDALK